MSGYTYRAGRELTPFEEDLLRRAKRAEALVARAERREDLAKAETKAAKAKLERVGRMARNAADADVRHVEALEAARDRTRGLLATLRKERAAARPEDEAERVRLTRELEQTRIRYTAANRDANHWRARCREENARAQEYLQTLADVAKGGQGQATVQAQEDQAASPEEVKAHRAEAVRLTRELAKSEEVRMAAQEALQQEREAHAERLAEANRRAALAEEERAHLQARLDGIKSQHREAMKSQGAAWRNILGHVHEKQAKERAALQARLDKAMQDQEDAWPGLLEQAHEQQRKEREELQARLDKAEARARSLEEQAEKRAALQARLDGITAQHEKAMQEQAASWRKHLRESLEEQGESWRIFLRGSLEEQAEKQAEKQAEERAALQARLDDAEARVRSLEEQAAEREDLLDDAEARVRSLEVKTEYTAASDTRTYGHLVELEARVRELAAALDDALIIARDATAERDQARAKAVEHEHAALAARQQAATAAAERDRAESAARQRDEDVWETQRMIHRLGQADAPASEGGADLPTHSGTVIVAPRGTSLEDMDRAMREHLTGQAKGFKPGGVIGVNTEDDNQDGEQQQ